MFDQKRIAELVKAKANIIEGSQSIWNVRLETLVRNGSLRDVLDHLKSPIEDVANNCGCNVQCGAAALNPADVFASRGE